MFSLISGYWKLLWQRSEFQIIILGMDRAGKTTLLEQMKEIFTGLEPLPPGKIPPTVGLNIGRMQVNGTRLVCWDLGGAAALRGLWEQYFADAHGLLYVIDASDASRFEASREALQGLLRNPDLAGIPLLVLANKQDAPGAATPHEVELRFGLGYSRDSSQPQAVLGVSALSGQGVLEGAHWLAAAVKSSPRALEMMK